MRCTMPVVMGKLSGALPCAAPARYPRSDTVPGAGGAWLNSNQNAAILPSVSQVSGGCCGVSCQGVTSQLRSWSSSEWGN